MKVRMEIVASDMKIGDVRVPGGTVTKLEGCNSDRGKVHVNGSDCYERGATVEVVRESAWYR